MKNLFSVVLCLLIFGLCLSVSSQTWIIDGKQTQVLKLDVADPQAIYTDGSRIIQAPLVYAQSCSSPTSGLVRAYFAPEEQYEHFFLIDGNSETVTLSSSANAGFKVGRTVISSSSLYNEDASVGMQFDDHLLSGGWNVDTVPDSPDAVMNRSYADTRYLNVGEQFAQPITFAHSLSQTSGVLRIYGIDDEDHIEYFKELSVQNGLQFSSVHSATLFFGQSFNDGLLIGPSHISQTGYGFGLDFEAGTLGGSWQISGNPSTESGIVNKGYADGRYLLRTTGITTNRVIQAGNTLVISNGLITAILP